MTYLIDGYNLMFAAGFVTRAMPAAQFDRARERFLDWLADGATGRSATLRVVFDAQQAPSPSLESVQRGVRVRFAFRQTADDLIEELVVTEPKPVALTVVSNDSRVREAGRRAGCERATCEEFIDWLIGGERGASAPCSSVPESDKPEPTSTDVDELLNVFSKPKPKT